MKPFFDYLIGVEILITGNVMIMAAGYLFYSTWNRK